MTDEVYMQRALELAALGTGAVSPNPLVGCVIVHQNVIIGEGFHQKYGGQHAEVNAINSVINQELLPHSTVYVTLEPCSHWGKTPPCANLLIKHKVKRVVIAIEDPFPEVQGRGIKRLREAGLQVDVGCLWQEAEKLNKVFLHSVRRNQPFVYLKWAETADGFVAKENKEPIQISGSLGKFWNHKMRSEVDAILIGSETAIRDNPRLTTRFWEGKCPLRLLLDPQGRVPTTISLFQDEDPLVVFSSKKRNLSSNKDCIVLDFEKNWIEEILNYLNQRKVRSVLIEGGPRLHALFFNADVWQEILILRSKEVVGRGCTSFKVPAIKKADKVLGNDLLFIFSK